MTVSMTVILPLLVCLGLSPAVLAAKDKNSSSVSDPLQRVMLEYHLYQVAWLTVVPRSVTSLLL